MEPSTKMRAGFIWLERRRRTSRQLGNSDPSQCQTLKMRAWLGTISVLSQKSSAGLPVLITPSVRPSRLVLLPWIPISFPTTDGRVTGHFCWLQRVFVRQASYKYPSFPYSIRICLRMSTNLYNRREAKPHWIFKAPNPYLADRIRANYPIQSQYHFPLGH
jgi:hypothetical protein